MSGDKNDTQQGISRRYSSIGFTVLAAIFFVLLLGVASIVAGIIFADDMKEFRREGYCWANAAAQLFLSAMILLLLLKNGIFNKREYDSKLIGKGLFIGLVGVGYALFQFGINLVGNFAYVQVPDLTYFLSNIFIAFTTGLFEEMLVRGFAYNNFRRCFGSSLEGMKKSAIWSSLLFGAVHVVNLSGFDLASILTTLSQMIYASIIGMFFCIVYIQSKSMWTVIIIHALIDGSTFVLNSMLSVEAFQASGQEVSGAGQLLLFSFVLPLLTMLPFIIAIIVKWKKTFLKGQED